MIFIGITICGAVGAMLRYFIGQHLPWSRTVNFPVSTLLINITGSALLGVLYRLYIGTSIPPVLWELLGVGLLGAFTTFSTFSYELLLLFEQKRKTAAIIYLVTTITLGIIAVAGGGYLIGLMSI